MKKKYFLLFTIILVCPLMVHAETEWHNRASNLRDVKCQDNASRTVAKSVQYSNGKYKMQDTIESFTIGSWPDESLSKVYLCDTTSTQECSNMYVAYRDISCQISSNRIGKMSYSLSEGITDVTSFYIGTDYKYENGMYTMTEYEEYPISDYTNVTYLSRTFEGKYFCKNYQKSCKTMYQIGSQSNTMFGELLSQLYSLDDYYLVSDSFTKKDGIYYLTDPRKVDLVRDGGVSGYSCHSKEDNCTTLYTIEVSNEYDGHDGRMTTYNQLESVNNVIEKELMLEDNYDVSTFFVGEEVTKVHSTDKSVAEIVDGKLVLYKVGTTDLIYEDDLTYKVIHLRVTNEMISNNPKTTRVSIFASLLGLALITALVIEKRKVTE